jgi:hypothetical protein
LYTAASSWRPILDGAPAEQAHAAIHTIAEALQHPPRLSEEAPHAGEVVSLAGGDAGLALFYTYMALAYPGQGHEERAVRCLERAFDGVGVLPLGPSLYSGFTGVAWAAQHLQGRLLDADDPNAAIDEALLAHLGRSPWRQDYDLISGLVGFGVYALERLPHPTAAACLELVVARLEEMAERRPEGLTWWTDPLWLPLESRMTYRHGYYNLGLAHGVPGVIALLGEVCAAGIAQRPARQMLDRAVSWLMAQQLPTRAGSRFTYWVGPGADHLPARLAWCYGDAGVAAALLCAARRVGEPIWEGVALDIAFGAAARAPEQAGVCDAGLCHGAAGLGHIFNRFYQATGAERFAQAARLWIERALDMRQPDAGVAGFRAWAPSASGQLDWVDDAGLLTGAAGIGLVLLAATTPIEPAWDRMLLVSAPARSQL